MQKIDESTLEGVNEFTSVISSSSRAGASNVASEPLMADPTFSRSILSRTLFFWRKGTGRRVQNFDGLILLLDFAKEAADVFPPLKSSAAAILMIGFKQNREEWLELAQDLTQFIVDINGSFQKPSDPVVARRLETLARSNAQRMMQIKADIEAISQYKSRLREKRDQLNTILLLHTSETMSEAVTTASIARSANSNDEGIRDFLKAHVTSEVAQRKGIIVNISGTSPGLEKINV
ncbi:hypothetical protein SISNIDRAFT_471435 [Sistotremastrum niveocremeum HHB9708]|uniref:Uncharacterized protein n=1 Tax=Sistotremastrum niveocremeum HHB9708 TaxID=1314777 RepID=A0A164MLX2_9AGAM|nr:hypothetical protein SISNIDRAFT_471435 [Sistotremastrum niveocremeum HHB9708]